MKPGGLGAAARLDVDVGVEPERRHELELALLAHRLQQRRPVDALGGEVDDQQVVELDGRSESARDRRSG